MGNIFYRINNIKNKKNTEKDPGTSLRDHTHSLKKCDKREVESFVKSFKLKRDTTVDKTNILKLRFEAKNRSTYIIFH
jgi:hypothetical protein